MRSVGINEEKELMGQPANAVLQVQLANGYWNGCVLLTFCYQWPNCQERKTVSKM